MKKRKTSARKRAPGSRRPESSVGADTPWVSGDLDRAAAAEETADRDAPGRDAVDELGNELGVPRAPDEEFRPSTEILEHRDRRCLEQEE